MAKSVQSVFSSTKNVPLP